MPMSESINEEYARNHVPSYAFPHKQANKPSDLEDGKHTYPSAIKPFW